MRTASILWDNPLWPNVKLWKCKLMSGDVVRHRSRLFTKSHDHGLEQRLDSLSSFTSTGVSQLIEAWERFKPSLLSTTTTRRRSATFTTATSWIRPTWATQHQSQASARFLLQPAPLRFPMHQRTTELKIRPLWRVNKLVPCLRSNVSQRVQTSWVVLAIWFVSRCMMAIVASSTIYDPPIARLFPGRPSLQFQLASSVVVKKEGAFAWRLATSSTWYAQTSLALWCDPNARRNGRMSLQLMHVFMSTLPPQFSSLSTQTQSKDSKVVRFSRSSKCSNLRTMRLMDPSLWLEIVSSY